MNENKQKIYFLVFTIITTMLTIVAAGYVVIYWLPKEASIDNKNAETKKEITSMPKEIKDATKEPETVKTILKQDSIVIVKPPKEVYREADYELVYETVYMKEIYDTLKYSSVSDFAEKHKVTVEALIKLNPYTLKESQKKDDVIVVKQGDIIIFGSKTQAKQVKKVANH